MFVFFTVYALGFQPEDIHVGCKLLALVGSVPAVGADVVGFVNYASPAVVNCEIDLCNQSFGVEWLEKVILSVAIGCECIRYENVRVAANNFLDYYRNRVDGYAVVAVVELNCEKCIFGRCGNGVIYFVVAENPAVVPKESSRR